MIFVVAPDSFKGSLTSKNVCDVVEQALLERFPGITVEKVPMADGGEGTVEALILATGSSACGSQGRYLIRRWRPTVFWATARRR